MRLDVSGCQGVKAVDENTISQENFENGTEIYLSVLARVSQAQLQPSALTFWTG